MTRPRGHRCEDGYVYHGSPLIGPALRRCSQCHDICTRCRNAGLFAPRWLGDPVAVAESIVFTAAQGHGMDLCPGCGGVLDMSNLVFVEGDPMTAVRIGRTAMAGETTRHRAAKEEHGWRVTWLPDRLLTYNQAATAMVLAETVATIANRDLGDRLWPQICQWGAELGLTGDAAVRLVSRPASPRRDLTQGDVS